MAKHGKIISVWLSRTETSNLKEVFQIFDIVTDSLDTRDIGCVVYFSRQIQFYRTFFVTNIESSS